MKPSLKIINAAAIGLALLASSCSETKVSQCNKILAVTNKLDPIGKNLEKNIQEIDRPRNPQNVAEIAGAFTKASGIFQNSSSEVSNLRTELLNLKLTDQKLKDTQTSYGGNLQQLGDSLKSLGDVAAQLGKVKNQNEFRTVLTSQQGNLAQNLQQIPKSTEDAKKAQSELNTYCEVKGTPLENSTPAPNATPSPTPTATPAETSTPAPGATPSPTPTATP